MLEMGRPAAAKAWRIIPRPILESVLNNHAQHHRVPQPILLLHGPRGVGKTSLLLRRLLPDWNDGPHLAAYVDFASDDAASAASYPTTTTSTPWWATSSSSPPRPLFPLRSRLERELESLVDRGVRLGAIGSRDVFAALDRWHGLHAALRRVVGPGLRLSPRRDESAAALWAKAVLTFSARIGPAEIDVAASGAGGSLRRRYSMEEAAYVREAMVALRLAKEVIGMHQEWRREAMRHLNRTGGFSRPLANSAIAWPCLLLEILSEAAQVDFFQVCCAA